MLLHVVAFRVARVVIDNDLSCQAFLLKLPDAPDQVHRQGNRQGMDFQELGVRHGYYPTIRFFRPLRLARSALNSALECVAPVLRFLASTTVPFPRNASRTFLPVLVVTTL